MDEQVKTQRVWEGSLPEAVSKDYRFNQIYEVESEGIYPVGSIFKDTSVEDQKKSAMRTAEKETAHLTEMAREDLFNRLEGIAEAHKDKSEIIADVETLKIEPGIKELCVTGSRQGEQGKGYHACVYLTAKAIGYIPRD